MHPTTEPATEDTLEFAPAHTATATTASLTTQRDHDGGWTLVEILLVILILGILALAVVFAISGMRAEAATSSCGTDQRSLAVAAESYFAETRSSSLPATGTDHDRFEQTLVAAGFLRDVSTYHDLDATGAATPEGNSPC